MTRGPIFPTNAQTPAAQPPQPSLAPPASEAFTKGSWAGQRWLRVVELDASPAAFAAGLTLARSSALRDASITPGHASVRVAEKGQRPQHPAITLSPISEDQWGSVIDAMADQALYAAKLLTAEMPTGIEDLFRPLGLRLFPDAASELAPTCACPDHRHEPGGWCKHACCLAAVVADRLRDDPFLIFRLRGLPSDDLIDRLRRKRATGGVRGRGRWFVRVPSLGSPAFLPQIDRLAPPDPPLDANLDSFWRIGPGLDSLDTTPRPPAIPHALLRRLGPSPFPAAPGGRAFPLIGLLATCYDVMTQHALRSDTTSDQDNPAAQPGDAAPSQP